MISVGIALTSQAVARRSAQMVFSFTSGGLPEGLALTRASSARYLDAASQLQTVGTDVARFQTDTASGQSYLLLEGAATNLMARSAVTASDWYVSGATLADQSLNALGVLDGASVSSNGQDWHRCFRNLSCTAGTDYAFRLYWQTGSSNEVMIQLKSISSGQSTILGGAAGSVAVGSTQEGVATILEDTLVDGTTTRMLHVHWVAATTGTYSFGIGPNSATTGAKVVPLALQVEAATAGSSYIPTNGSVQSRQADALATTSISGDFDITAQYLDQPPVLIEAVTVATGVALPIPHGRVTSLEFIPV
jgi:hypothetical protein